MDEPSGPSATMTDETASEAPGKVTATVEAQDSEDEGEVNMKDLLSTIMKGVSKAFATSTANRPKEQEPKTVEPEPAKPLKRPSQVSIRMLPNEATEIHERKYMKIANNGVVKLFELLNQS